MPIRFEMAGILRDRPAQMPLGIGGTEESVEQDVSRQGAGLNSRRASVVRDAIEKFERVGKSSALQGDRPDDQPGVLGLCRAFVHLPGESLGVVQMAALEGALRLRQGR